MSHWELRPKNTQTYVECLYEWSDAVEASLNWRTFVTEGSTQIWHAIPIMHPVNDMPMFDYAGKAGSIDDAKNVAAKLLSDKHALVCLLADNDSQSIEPVRYSVADPIHTKSGRVSPQSLGGERNKKLAGTRSETDFDEILSPQPRPHPKLLNTSQFLLQQNQSRPLSPLNPSRGRTASFASIGPESTLHGQPHESSARRFVRWMARNGLRDWTPWVIIAGSVLVKCAVGLGGYSGERTKPMYGDYEAQRHWMEITYHLPISQWYSYDLQYWGLDYPPLTAYVSWICGFVAHKINPEWVALDASRGYESPTSKHFMRMSVLILEVLVYISAVYVYTRIALPGRSRRTQVSSGFTGIKGSRGLWLMACRYNSVMLGLALWAVNMFHLGYDLIGAVFFVASLGFKQMALYYAPAVGSYLLGKCFWLGKNHGTRHFAHLALTTSLSFVLLFLPFLTPSLLTQSIKRIFPFARGLFEDKVANFWCASDVALVKWRKLAWISEAGLQRVALLVTLLGILPGAGMVFGWGFISGAKSPTNSSNGELAPINESTDQSTKLARRRGPTLSLLPFALFSCAMSFFMFSVQVHEKSILLPLMPITLLLAARESETDVENVGMGLGNVWEWGVLVNNVAIFRWVRLNYVVLTLLWNYLVGYDPLLLLTSPQLAYVTIAFIHTLETFIPPPTRYPDFYPVLNVLLSASVFGATWIAVGGIMMIQSAWAAGGFDTGSASQKPIPLRSLNTSISAKSSPVSPNVSETFVTESVRKRRSGLGDIGRIGSNGSGGDGN
ncbi:glucosyltransferase [Rhizoctonia solani AG-1 IA]|uniref:Alpha-1,3-glucosyltransferase n=1 Tax=Thanatephorus cucumeris (strain AG1-IA) TaxID=983506 RepID=L8WN02_THACA|nr:glucosyltransferase [Rhizoctonia solani AG-1 IA]